MKIIITDKCIGCGACATINGDMFDIEYNRGYIDRKDADAVKTIQNRIYMAKKTIKKNLNEYGITKTEGNYV